MDKHLIVIDPELKSYTPVGHCLPLDIEICQNAQTQGYIASIIARDAINPLLKDGIEIIPSLTNGLWEINEVDKHHQPLHSDIVDLISLTNKAIGSFRNYEKSKKIDNLILQARGLANLLPYIFYLAKNPNKRSYVRSGIRFVNEIIRGLPAGSFNKNSIILVQHTCGLQLYGWALFALFSELCSGPKISIILRYEHNFYLEFVDAFGLIRPYVQSGIVHYVSDSGRLVKDYEKITECEIKLIPVPHATHNTNTFNSKHALEQEQKNVLTFGSLGGARKDKGFQEICEAISLLHAKGELEGKNFILHAHSITENSCEENLRELQSMNLKQVTIITDPLSNVEYNDLMSRIDVLLLPYQRNLYPSRTSGILVEAMIAGKVCIVTGDTWLSDELEVRGSGLICESESPEDLVISINNVAQIYSALHAKAIKNSFAAADWHNPQRAVRFITEFAQNKKA